MVYNVDPEKVENNPDIEKQWAVKALMHAECYYKLLCSIDRTKLKLTPIDEEIYEHFRKEFPDFAVDIVDVEKLKSNAAKELWRPWMMTYENKVEDFNFGTLLRINSSEDYTEENSIFVPRIQFLAIELARNREGFNKIIRGHQRMKEAFEMMASAQKLIIDGLVDSYPVKVDVPEPDSYIPLPVNGEFAGTAAGVSSSSSSAQKKKKRKQDGPRKTSGYLVFCEEERSKQRSNSDEEKCPAQEFMTMIGHKWSTLDDSVKYAYNERAKELNEKYKKEYEDHLASGHDESNTASPSASNPQHQEHIATPVAVPQKSVEPPSLPTPPQQEPVETIVPAILNQPIAVAPAHAVEEIEKKKKKKKKSKKKEEEQQ